ncbi:MAG: 6-phosphogluconolactonase [Chloroflexota bacterium]|nr:6-phosphogluconolactonase [Chloroflexota bacterium]
MSEVVVRKDPEAVARQAATWIVRWARAAVAERGQFRIALAGGGTPARLYELLAREPYRSILPVAQTEVFWGDERFLPHGNAGRNDTHVLPLLSEAGIPGQNINPVPYVAETSDKSCADSRLARSAHLYEKQLQTRLEPGHPLMDVILLGLGTDGHTASLFPDTAALSVTDHLVAPNRSAYEDRHPERITLTFPAINASRIILFMVTGRGKRDILRRVLDTPESPVLPAQLVAPTSGNLLWLADEAATSSVL